MKKPLVTYVYHPHYKHVRVACLVAALREDGTIGIGVSQCHPTDNFDKALGREKAFYRALHGGNPTPTPYKFFNPDGTHVKKDVVGQRLDLFRFQAMNYFSPRLAEDADRSIDQLTGIALVVMPEELADQIGART